MRCAYIIDHGSELAAGWNKLAVSGVSLSMNNENVTFPATYLINKIASKPAKFTAKSGLQVNIDFGSSQKCNLIAILGHNLSASATITLKNDSASAMGSPDISQSITWADEEIYALITGTNTNQYWRLEIEDAAHSSYPFIGELVMGEYIEFSQNYSWKLQETTKYNSSKHTTQYGQIHSYYFNETRSIRGLNFKNIDDTTAAELATMYKNAKGSHYPLVFVWDADDNLATSIYGKLADHYGRKFEFVDLNSITGISCVGLPFAKELDDS